MGKGKGKGMGKGAGAGAVGHDPRHGRAAGNEVEGPQSHSRHSHHHRHTHGGGIAAGGGRGSKLSSSMMAVPSHSFSVEPRAEGRG